mmetsp:Transcript_67283/g.194601  ORF Transcript_67283/g.194601 Transcript_67283/m.194601 type:complete len:831 (+) Transcript_67283:105-2597(+)
MIILRHLLVAALFIAKLVLLAYCCLRAYRIRLHAVETFGYVIHEFDPWFNFRATEYLAEHGLSKFFKWYDYMSWYPIGRPVGTTIYPGMQIVSVWIWEAMKHIPTVKYKMPKEILTQIPKWLLFYLPNKGKGLSFGPMSLNDVCCMVPAWFGAVATFLTFMWAWEASESSNAALFAAAVMSILPAHIMRSMSGEFDNECVAVSTFCLVLWLWSRSVRTPSSWPCGILAGIAYITAAVTWGGYIFINNLIGLHAAVLVVLGKYSTGLYRAYTLYYLIGTIGAMQLPVIGWAPIRSLEQMPSLLTFAVYQLMELCEIYRRHRKQGMSARGFFLFRVAVFSVVAAVCAAVVSMLVQLGYFMPLGARIRGLFLEAVKTGNPLVDSVAEHSPANEQAYNLYLASPRYLAAIGLLFCWHQKTPGKFLVFLYAAVAYHYSLKMSRLIIICGPIVSVLAGFPVGVVGDWCVNQILNMVSRQPEEKPEPAIPLRTGGMGSIWRTLWRIVGASVWPAEMTDLIASKETFKSRFWVIDRPIRAAAAVGVAAALFKRGMPYAKEYIKHCDEIAVHMSNPQLVFQTTLRNGESIIVDDYLRGYEWIRDNTPEDARVMAWWDYGYQITGVARRTSIADGNTWNHEHIATLGRILTSTEKRSHNAMRHLADYVLVWAGGHGDDMGKSPHLARIGNSVFPDHCGDDDPLCHKFSFYQDGSPTPMMAKSFLYKAVNHNVKPGVTLSTKYWKEVHTTKYGLMRVYQVLNVSQESKDWIADPANRVCDAPGSWYCVGQYPPALKPLIEKRRNFAQLEDFNRKGEKSAYTKHIEQSRKGGKAEASASDEL